MIKENFLGEGTEQILPEKKEKEPERLAEELKFIRGQVEKIDQTQAQIRLDDGQIINCKKMNLPAGCREGDEVRLSLLGKEELAKEILNTIFKSTEKNE